LRLTPNARLRRLLGDPHVLLAIAIAISATMVAGVEGSRTALLVGLAGIAYVAVQVAVAARHGVRHPLPRLLAAVAFLFGVAVAGGPANAVPLTLLSLPIVAAGARYDRRTALIVAIAAWSVPAVPALAGLEAMPVVLARGSAFLATILLLAAGARLTVEAMESAYRRARASMARERRRHRQMDGVEAVGRILAADVSPEALEQVMSVLVDRFGYSHVSIYLKDDDGSLVLGAQRGYAVPVHRFDATTGVIGRVIRTGAVQFVPDATLDPDYRSADDAIRSEISAPLLAGGELIGVLNLEDTREAGLDETDRSTLVLVAERLAGAIALGRDRRAVSERAARFAALAEFARTINESLDPREAFPTICAAISEVLPSDIVILTVRDEAVGDYRIAAVEGGDARFLGVRIPEGEGVTGTAIAERRIVVDGHLERDRFPSTVRTARVDDVLTTLAVPLERDGEVLGALSLSRRDLDRPYAGLDLEVAPTVAGLVALAIANTSLHSQVARAATLDALTGLANRRHLDDSLARLVDARERMRPEDRRPVSAILFDLDLFGAFNKLHGHRVGDSVLRTFAAMLTDRFRASDIVARYGGEEFLVILDGATLDEARRAAEDIRAAFASVTIDAPTGPLQATVSAGCTALGPSVNSISLLLEVADVALQMAKRGGRNQVVAA
jgi:diguanylate cyclase (GGDEF)-like protein